MPGTPVSDISVNELPSPSGNGAGEDGVRSSYILPHNQEDDDEGEKEHLDPKDRFRLKIALEASRAKLNNDLNLDRPPKRIGVFTKGRKMTHEESRVKPYKFNITEVLKAARQRRAQRPKNMISLNHLSPERNLTHMKESMSNLITLT